MEDFCSICQESQNTFINQQTKFVSNNVQSCGHLFCQTCISRQLDRKKSFPCPICDTTVSKLTLSEQSLDHKYCDDDATWRKRVLAVYNKSQSDFPTLVEYNDYLEEIEDVIYCIVNDEPTAKSHIDKVKRLEHTDERGITERQSRRAEEARQAEEMLTTEDAEAERWRRERNEEVVNEKMLKGKLKKQKMEVHLGERTEVSNELSAKLALAKKLGYSAAFSTPSLPSSSSQNPSTVRVFINGELRDAKAVRDMKGEPLKLRIKGMGGVEPNTREDRDLCWRECLGSLFI
ncbi:hypothetical protein TrCOL_g6941 [Triparma columacea]|uniref:RING-type domain-containing protein n=1 Tax=Triparma columacea TaxID=722753 RepID=A0A9W7LAA2_9STRA|nr:hypothetical protein TrCOL_g6941 [Triparma columacea]